MNWKGYERKPHGLFKMQARICLEVLRKITETICHDRNPPEKYSQHRHPEYKAVLAIKLPCLVSSGLEQY
jgi:hypothetical protein